MNAGTILGILLAMAGLGSWAVWERGDAQKWHRQYDDRVSQEKDAAATAKADADAQEQRDLQNLAQQSTAAVGQAQLEKQQAQKQLALYLQRGNEASKGDLGHACFSVAVPSDLLP